MIVRNLNLLACEWAVRLIGCVLTLIALLLVAEPVNAGSIKIESASLRGVGDVYVLDANVSVDLNSTIESGLKSGVPLFFNADVSVWKKRRFWWDKRIAKYRHRYSIVYYELTRHYRVSVVDEDEIKNFRSLLTALDYIGEIRNMRLFPVKLLEQQSSLWGEFEVFLDVSELPLPLRPQTLVSSDWRLRSEEFQWPIN